MTTWTTTEKMSAPTTTIEVLNRVLVGKYMHAEFPDYSSYGDTKNVVGEIIGVAEIDGSLRALVFADNVISSCEIDSGFEAGLTPKAITYTEAADAA